MIEDKKKEKRKLMNSKKHTHQTRHQTHLQFSAPSWEQPWGTCKHCGGSWWWLCGPHNAGRAPPGPSHGLLHTPQTHHCHSSQPEGEGKASVWMRMNDCKGQDEEVIIWAWEDWLKLVSMLCQDLWQLNPCKGIKIILTLYQVLKISSAWIYPWVSVRFDRPMKFHYVGLHVCYLYLYLYLY